MRIVLSATIHLLFAFSVLGLIPGLPSAPLVVRAATVDVVPLSSGSGHTCAITAAGGVACWGRNTTGELGDGTTNDRNVPVAVSGLAANVVAVAAGYDHTCALTAVGAVKCWGSNWFGQLGDGTTSDSSVPIDVSGLSTGVTAIAAGSYHTCAIMTTGALKCWGNNWFGQLGNGMTTAGINSSPSVPGD